VEKHTVAPQWLIGGAVAAGLPMLAGMAKKLEPPQPTSWAIYKVTTVATWLGTIEAPDEAAAIEKAAQEFKTDGQLLRAVAGR
jgi:hypothetical protein